MLLEDLQEVERSTVHLRDDAKRDRRLRQIRPVTGVASEELREAQRASGSGPYRQRVRPRGASTLAEELPVSAGSQGGAERGDVEQGAEAADELEAESGRER